MPIRHLQEEGAVRRDDFNWVALDLAVEGAVLAFTIWGVRGLDNLAATVIAIYLAAMAVVRVFFGAYDNLRASLYSRLACTLFVVLFSGWLLFEAKFSRTGWYRTNVIQDRVHKIVNDAPAAILVADMDGRITSVSRELAETLGYLQDALIGSDVRKLIPEAKWPELELRLEEAKHRLKGAKPEEAGWLKRGRKDFSLIRKDGVILTGHVYSGAIRWSEAMPFEGDSDIFAVFVAGEGKP